METAKTRTAVINRETKETGIALSLTLDSNGQSEINTGVGFLDHMLDLLAKHGGMELKLHARGDLAVDAHHTVEDVGICLGQALKTALGDKYGIERYGHVLLPMDEALVLVALDLSGRAFLAYDLPLPTAKVGDFDTELAEEFFRAFASNGALTLHVRLLAGNNTHHIIEAAFKGLGRALRLAVEIKDPQRGLPSTKGLL
ncbi:Imidazoleglycerol-phosphate dehydratase [Sporotomaculum syntrophicum]|uniref:Imidazoleglycerol-phosphate dehydratase n=1 Tax=Sporotomaculum syntrophicum TaxID=182264 RepID=A0A9D3B008_9FIRM|nr:imidazoleglycerol-phosphate dehydratase HisB [Sporotomaculum syntrophicum]KAF1086428.1 Imidazoleglycerol-phosphate dehydratase [Sporotomaculum syntrophicum]